MSLEDNVVLLTEAINNLNETLKGMPTAPVADEPAPPKKKAKPTPKKAEPKEEPEEEGAEETSGPTNAEVKLMLRALNRTHGRAATVKALGRVNCAHFKDVTDDLLDKLAYVIRELEEEAANE